MPDAASTLYVSWNMEFKDYYSILGVEQGASDDDIRKAYRKLARKYHPDVSKESDAETRMRDVNEAYDVLRDAEKRQAYDNLAAGVSPGGGFQPPPGWDEGFEFHRGAAPGDEAQISEFFSSLFGGRGGRHGARQQEFRARGEDHHAAIEVDLEDAIKGATRDISLRSMQMDDQGRPHMQSRTLSVKIPAGVREGQYIRLAGQGMPGYGGGDSGDLYLEVRFKPHPRYRAEGRDRLEADRIRQLDPDDQPASQPPAAGSSREPCFRGDAVQRCAVRQCAGEDPVRIRRRAARTRG